MADKQKKEPTPPPLLLMPAGGGLTLTPPEQPSLYMPVIQSEPSLFGPEDEGLGEADSFVGQSPPQPPVGAHVGNPPTSSIFQTPTKGSDPFSNISRGSTPLQPPLGPPSISSTPFSSQNTPTMAPTSQGPHSGSAMSSMPPLPNASGLQGLYRKHGSSRYAPMPSGTYASGQSPANLMSGAPAPTPFSSNFSEASTFEPSPSNPPATLPPQPSIGQLPGLGYVPNATGTYIPVIYHWCLCKNIEGRDVWYPFSMADNITLEDAFKSGETNVVVSTDGGRYDVNVTERRRYSVYWEEEPTHVQRCSWFYKRERDNKYVPYEENFARRLEEEYKTAVTSGVWHKPIQFDSGETVVMHNPNVMVHYTSSSQPDEWGTVQVSNLATAQGDQMRPRVVKRGVGDFESIDEGESRQVDHLIFVVHGIGTVCDIRFRSIIECVDDFRSISQSLLSSHFTEYVESHRIGRVEYIPIQWHTAVHGDATGIDKRLKAITLPSTAKLRHFVNDTLMDVLFYTSPTYCQCISDTVGHEINRLYDLFLSRNPTFQGGVSVAGHSLGSCILFDLLQNQGDGLGVSTELTNGIVEPDPVATLTLAASQLEPEVEDVEDNDDEDDGVLTMEQLLSKVGLQDKLETFQQEQIDMESLIMCSESDLKDLGLPMGPRKKLQGILKEEQQKKDKKKILADKKLKQEEDRRLRERLAAELALQQQQQQQQRDQGLTPVRQSSSLSVDYLVGVGGTGQPQIKYVQLKFNPVCCFALGSPVGLFLSARGVEAIGEDFRLPTCQKYFNIFHPFDPVAYRLEPLINPSVSHIKPVLMPHHKGRKRLHLELKESLARMGTDIKQKIIDSLKSTWTSINNFARAHQSENESLEQQVETEMSNITQQFDDDDKSDTASVTSAVDDVYIGLLNEGRRVDYVLQERPIESFNDYMFSLTSHGCYWNSEDTVLLVLKEIYSLIGILPKIPGAETYIGQKSRAGLPPKGPPVGPSYSAPSMPTSSFNQPPSSMSNINNYGQSYGSPLEPPQMFNTMGSPPLGPPQMPVNSGLPPLSGPPPFSMGQPAQPPASVGPPPMAGFVKKS